MTRHGAEAPPLAILVIEDDDDVAAYLIEELAGADPVTGRQCEVRRAASIGEALELAEQHTVDLVLLDLRLPDSEDLTTVLRILDGLPQVPVIVVTGSREEEFVEEAMRAGAHDYLLKSEVARDSLWRSIRHTLLRHQTFLANLTAISERSRLDEELRSILGGARSGVTSAALGLEPLRERSFTTFDQLGERYRDLLEVTMRTRTHDGRADREPGLRALADELGFLRAGPRDVIELHVQSMETVLAGTPRTRASALLDSGRIQLVEVMGHLVAYYRAQALGVIRRPTASQSQNGEHA